MSVPSSSTASSAHRRPRGEVAGDTALFALAMAVGMSVERVRTCETFIEAWLPYRQAEAAVLWLANRQNEAVEVVTLYPVCHQGRAGDGCGPLERDHPVLQKIRSGGACILMPAEARSMRLLTDEADSEGVWTVEPLGERGLLGSYFAAGPVPAMKGPPEALQAVLEKFTHALETCEEFERLRRENERTIRDLPSLQSGPSRVQALEPLNLFYEQVLNAIPINLAVFDTDLRYRFVSPSAVADPERRAWMIGKTDVEYCEARGLGKDVAVQRMRLLKETIEARETRRFEESFTGRDGRLHHFLRIVAPVLDVEGRAQQVMGYGLDITDQKEAEAAQRAAASRLSALIETLPSGLMVEDEYRHIALINQAFCDLFAIPAPPEALLGADCEQSAEQFKHLFKDPDAFETGIETCLRERQIVRAEELRLADGRTFERDYIPIFQDEAYLGHMWQYWDITGRREEQRALRDSEARKSAMLAAALDCVITIDEEGRIIDFNPAAEQTFGYRRDDVLGQSMADIIVPPQLRAAHNQGMQHYQATGEGPVLGKRVELTALRADGSEFPVELAIQVIELEDRKLFTAYLRDITERKWAEEELIRANRLAEQSVEAKERFLANMSHEMRTPLNAVIGMTHLLLETAPDQRQKKYLDAINFSADNLLVLINDILDIAKIGAGKITFESMPFPPAEVVRQTVDTVQFKAEEKGLSLKVLIDHDLPQMVEGDPIRLHQVLLNVISNALKFTEEGAVKVMVEVEEKTAETIRLRFEVADTGIGIPADKLDHIFESFSQARDDVTRRYGGTGLGLTIVKELTERQGGRVNVQSRVGEGSVFTVSLPFRRVADEDVAQAAQGGDRRDEILLNGIRILVVEDNEMNQFLARSMLEQWGAHAEIAENGAVAIRLLEQQSYDLVLMDIQMPVMDGYAATRYIRETMDIPADILPILALTASTLTEHRQKIEDAGMNDFILKPFNLDDLRRRIAAHLGLAPGLHVQATSAEPEASYLDLAYLEASSNGRKDFVANMIALFAGTVKKSIASLETALEEDREDQVRFVAHKLKSSAGLLGARPLMRVLEEIEACEAGEGKGSEVLGLAEVLLRRCEEALDAVEEYSKGEGGERG